MWNEAQLIFYLQKEENALQIFFCRANQKQGCFLYCALFLHSFFWEGGSPFFFEGQIFLACPLRALFFDRDFL